MSSVAIILATVSIVEAAMIVFLLFTMNKIIERITDLREPVEPINTCWEDEYERDE